MTCRSGNVLQLARGVHETLRCLDRHSLCDGLLRPRRGSHGIDPRQMRKRAFCLIQSQSDESVHGGLYQMWPWQYNDVLDIMHLEGSPLKKTAAVQFRSGP